MPTCTRCLKEILGGPDTGAMCSACAGGVIVAEYDIAAVTVIDPRTNLVAQSCPSSISVKASPIKPSIPGYTVESAIGNGGMGTVYLARQLSLDRPVALKVMSPQWAKDPVFVARFTREAFAAAQLNHPNIVQIHDIGVAPEGHRYISMEFVEGQSLAETVREKGPLAPAVAVGYILQAARGLRHAHDRGMIHRDVKPDNLLLANDGIVKVADLGLVKTANTPAQEDRPCTVAFDTSGTMTGVAMALGTPAYMSPEQCRDATLVDLRSDVYSLGATLYALLTARPPFEGVSGPDLMKKHAYEPLKPPHEWNSKIPLPLSQIIQKMMAKDPSQRFFSMVELINALEGWLGVYESGTFVPKVEDVATITMAARSFRMARGAKARTLVIGAFHALGIIAVVFLALSGRLNWAFGVAGLMVQTTLASLVLQNCFGKTDLARRARKLTRGLSIIDYGLVFIGLFLFTLLLARLEFAELWLGFGMVGIAFAIAVRVWLNPLAQRDRYPALEQARTLLRRLRTEGYAEDDLRVFVARASGRYWEEFYESLFGYDAKLIARAELLRTGKQVRREKFASWRDPFAQWMERLELSQRERRERAILTITERNGLLAKGMSGETASIKASQQVMAMVNKASAIRASLAGSSPTSSSVFEQLVAAADSHDGHAVGQFGFHGLLKTVAGNGMRMLLTLGLLVLFTLWAGQNQWWEYIQKGQWANLPTEPLQIEGVPLVATSWVQSINIGLAGLVLLISLGYPRARSGVFAIAGAGIIACGHLVGFAPLGPFHGVHLSLLLGIAIALVGFRLHHVE